MLAAFRCERSAGRDAGVRVGTRHGGGVRVYLDRPWFAPGQLLAVAL